MRLSDGSRPSSDFDTEQQAWEWNLATKRAFEAGRLVLDSKVQTGKFLDEWVETAARRQLRPNTLYNYRLSVGYVKPWIGTIRLCDLRLVHLERTFAGLESGDEDRAPLARSTQAYTFRVLKGALEWAVDNDMIAKSPMRRMKPPRVDSVRDTVLSVEDCRRILEDAAGTRWYALLWILATTGARISETLGIEWRNVDLGRGLIRLERQSLQRMGTGGTELSPLKSAASQRTLIVPPVVCDALQWHRGRQEMERAEATRRGTWEEHGTVFCTVNGKLYARNQIGAAFRDIRYRLNLDETVTLHTFRHTVATLLQNHGLSLKDAQAVLGHASGATTLQIYSHPTLAAQERAALAMGAIYGDGAIIDGEIVERKEP